MQFAKEDPPVNRTRFDALFELFVFRQRRVTANRTFICYKFRTMYRGAERFPRSSTLYGKNLNDPRIIPWMKWMRRVGLDELPQLFNVLIGDMNFFGARPITEAEFLRLSSKHKNLRERSKAGCFGPYAALRRRKNENNLCQANEAFLILFYRRRKLGRTALALFELWVLWRTFVAILQGRVK